MRSRPPEAALTGREVASSNTTLNKFLKGKTKSWMTGERVEPSPRPAGNIYTLSSANVIPSPAPSDEPSPGQILQDSPSIDNAVLEGQSTSRRPSIQKSAQISRVGLNGPSPVPGNIQTTADPLGISFPVTQSIAASYVPQNQSAELPQHNHTRLQQSPNEPSQGSNDPNFGKESFYQQNPATINDPHDLISTRTSHRQHSWTSINPPSSSSLNNWDHRLIVYPPSSAPLHNSTHRHKIGPLTASPLESSNHRPDVNPLTSLSLNNINSRPDFDPLTSTSLNEIHSRPDVNPSNSSSLSSSSLQDLRRINNPIRSTNLQEIVNQNGPGSQPVTGSQGQNSRTINDPVNYSTLRGSLNSSASTSKSVADSQGPSKRLKLNLQGPAMQANVLPSPPLVQTPGQLQQSPRTDLKSRIPIIDEWIRQTGGHEKLNSVLETHRFILLRDACNNEDFFFVALHQLFCLWSLHGENLIKIKGLSELGFTHPGVLSAAFSILSQLIKENNLLSLKHLNWLSIFPAGLEELLSAPNMYRDSVALAGSFLTKLASYWQIFTKECQIRRYPPLVEEMVVRLGIYSPVLQGVFFTASRRNMGIRDDQIGVHLESLFAEDREKYLNFQSRYQSNNHPTAKEVGDWRQKVVSTYQNLVNAEIVRDAQPRMDSTLANMQRTRFPSAQNRGGQGVSVGFTLPNQHGSMGPPHYLGGMTAAGQISPGSANQQSPLLQNSPEQGFFVPPSEDQHILSRNHAQNLQQPFVSSPSITDSGAVLSPHAVQTHGRQESGSSLQSQQFNPNQLNTQGFAIHSYRRSSNTPQQQSGNLRHDQLPIHSDTQHEPALYHTSVPGRSHNISLSINGTQDAYNPDLHPPNRPISNHMPQADSRERRMRRTSQQVSVHSQNPDQLIPPHGSIIQPHAPNPNVTALHQAHLRSPLFLNKSLPAAAKYYQTIKSCQIVPLSPHLVLTDVNFVVTAANYEMLARDTIVRVEAPAVREVENGSTQYRVRCVEIKKDAWDTDIKSQDWVVMECVWPTSLCMELNGDVLELRRKNLHGKYLPVDITSFVAGKGPNAQHQLRVAFPRPGKNHKDRYAVAVEVVEILSHSQIEDMVLKEHRIPAQDTLAKIKRSLAPLDDDDDEIAMVESDLTINLADPFMAKIFDIPVRGQWCLHKECFDLDTFLNTRVSKSNTDPQPCLVDVWKCPLCGKDARPYCLQVDEFMISVRQRLELDDLLHVTAITISADGTWQPKIESDSERKTSMSLTKGGEGYLSDEEDKKPTYTRTSTTSSTGFVKRANSASQPPAQLQRRFTELVELDDD